MSNIFDSEYASARQSPNKRIPGSSRLSEDHWLTRGNNFEKIHARVKSLFRNNWFVKAATLTMVDYLCGYGGLKPVGGSSDANKAWESWTGGFVDWENRRTWIDLQGQIVQGMCEGDILIVRTNDQDAKGISTRIQLIDGSLIRTPVDRIDDKSISLGIKYDSNRREVGYWVKKFNAEKENDESSSNFVFVPRFDENGLFRSLLVRNPDPGMVRQSRGLNLVNAVMPEVEDLGKMSDSAVRAAIVKNYMSLVYRTGNPARINKAIAKNDEQIAGQANEVARVGSLMDGSIQALPADEGPIETITHSGNADLASLKDSSLRDACAGIGIPFEIIVSSFKGVSFSSGKLSFDKFFRKLDRWEQALSSVFNLIRSIVVYESSIANDFENDGSVTMWIGAPRPDVDPVKTESANTRGLQNGTRTRSKIVSEQSGVSYDEHLKLLKQERDKEIEILGAPLGTSAIENEQPNNEANNE